MRYDWEPEDFFFIGLIGLMILFVIGFFITISIDSNTDSNNLKACVEAGLQWIDGNCVKSAS